MLASCLIARNVVGQAAEAAVARLAPDASALAVERVVEEALIRECRAYNQRKPLVTVIAHEHSSRAGSPAYNEAIRRASARIDAAGGGESSPGGARRGGRRPGSSAPRGGGAVS